MVRMLTLLRMRCKKFGFSGGLGLGGVSKGGGGGGGKQILAGFGLLFVSFQGHLQSWEQALQPSTPPYPFPRVLNHCLA